MRGSPLIRFLLLALGLAATGLGLQRVTSARVSPRAPVAPTSTTPAVSEQNRVPFRLLLSAPAAAVEIDTGHLLHLEPTESAISGSLELDPANPHLALLIRWKLPSGPGEQRFAKLTLEVPGQDTYTHVFDAAGDIDDFLELPVSQPK